MPYLASFVPPGIDVTHVDEETERADREGPYDLVAMTFHTPSALHAYETAAAFRKRGITVAMGGPHVTLVPEEARLHADVIFRGEAETTWPLFLDEFLKNIHKNEYISPGPENLEKSVMSRKDLFNRNDLSGGILFATRGCPNDCEFCAISKMYGRGVRKRPVEEVAFEFGSFQGKIVIFWDENIAADKAYSKELFKAIAHHGKWWSSQAGVCAGHDDEFLELAAKSGCKQLFLGIESINQDSLDETGKSFNRAEGYLKTIRNIQAHGIAVQAGIVFGFDRDDGTVFDRTVDFLEEAGVQNATFNILTPYPGTALFGRLEAEGRIITRDWERYNARADVVFSPARMGPGELLEGFRHANRRFYSLKSIAKRMWRSPTGLYWTLPLNLMYHMSMRIHGDPHR